MVVYYIICDFTCFNIQRRWYSERSKRKNSEEKKIVGDARTRTRDLEVGSQVRYRYTKTFPIEITRKRKIEFSNPTL